MSTATSKFLIVLVAISSMSNPEPGSQLWRKQIMAYLQNVNLPCKEASGFVKFIVNQEGRVKTVMPSKDIPPEIAKHLIEAICQTQVKGKKSKWYVIRIRFTDVRCTSTHLPLMDRNAFGAKGELWNDDETPLNCIYLKPLTIAF